jgi:hypothetical protein
MGAGLNPDQREARVKLVGEHLRAENTHNLDAIMDTFGNDLKRETYRGLARYTGHRARI